MRSPQVTVLRPLLFSLYLNDITKNIDPEPRPFADNSFRVVLGWAYRGLTGGFLLLQNFSVAISVSPHVCSILVLILISMFLR